jgi:hypothetical protein
MSASGVSPTMTPVRVLRASAERPNFDGSEEFMLPPRHTRAAVVCVGTPAWTPVGTVTSTSAASYARGDACIYVDIAHLTDIEHIFAHKKIAALLRPFPPLDGIMSPTLEAMDSFQPLMEYLRVALCPEAAGKMVLRTLVSVVQRMPRFAAASEAVVGAVCVELGLADRGSWTVENTNKLDKWCVRATFWDVHVPRSSYFSVPEDDFHQRLILAAKELDLAPVCITGHGFLVSIVRQYVEMLTEDVVHKRAVDCVLATFGSHACIQLLNQTRYVDALDGMSIPLRTSRQVAPWPAILRKHVRADADTGVMLRQTELTPEERAGALGDAIVQAAKPYCWMLVAACHTAFPLKFTGAKPRTWEAAMIAWDMMDGPKDRAVE